jgi:hypothetical protein
MTAAAVLSMSMISLLISLPSQQGFARSTRHRLSGQCYWTAAAGSGARWGCHPQNGKSIGGRASLASDGKSSETVLRSFASFSNFQSGKWLAHHRDPSSSPLGFLTPWGYDCSDLFYAIGDFLGHRRLSEPS